MSDPASSPSTWQRRLRHLLWKPRIAGPGITSGAVHAVTFLFLFATALAVANLLFTAREVTSIRRTVGAECHFFADLSSAPLTVNPVTGRPAALGVEVISDARQAWRGLHCGGALPPPSQSFLRWARYYHLPAR